MELTKEQKLFSQVVQKAWDSVEFKNELIANPISAIEEETGVRLQIPNGRKIIVRDQSNASNVYINIPPVKNDIVSSKELSDLQLEAIAGGRISVNEMRSLMSISPLEGCFPTNADY